MVLLVIFGLVAICSAICVVAFKNPIHSALALILTFFSQAGLFIALGAHFVAAVQVIVYVGGILVLIIFGVMLTNKLEKPSINISSFNPLVIEFL